MRLKKIKGTVFFDSGSGTEEAGKSGLNGVGIKLYRIVKTDRYTDDEGGPDTSVYREILLGEARTDKNGEYAFICPDGDYSVCLDAGTLPEGILSPGFNTLVFSSVRGHADFHVYKSKTASGISKAFIIDNKGNSAMDTGIRECAAEMLENAYRNGIIDEHMKVLHKLYTVLDREMLADEYRSGVPIKSGTGMLEEIRKYMAQPESHRYIVEEAKRCLRSMVPELDRVYRSPGGFFNIHYTNDGDNAAYGGSVYGMVPPYIRKVAETFDNVLAYTCGRQGCRRPVLDEGAEAMDVNVYNLKGIYGMTSSVNYHTQADSGARTASCFICIDNDFSPSKGFEKNRYDCMRVTAAHEFFHAVQYAYNVDADTWWKEASATWNEDEVYAGVNDYVRYIGNYFAAPDMPLEKSSYGGVVFAKYLSENLGGSEFIRKIWESHASAQKSSTDVIDMVIKDNTGDEDLGTVFDRFTACNFNPAQYYKEGANWKLKVSVQNEHADYPVSNEVNRLDHLASSYHVFKPSAAAEEQPLKLAVEGRENARWGFKLQKRRKTDDLCSITEIGPAGRYDRVETVISDCRNYNELCLIPANLEKGKNHLPYTYSAEYGNS